MFIYKNAAFDLKILLENRNARQDLWRYKAPEILFSGATGNVVFQNRMFSRQSLSIQSLVLLDVDDVYEFCNFFLQKEFFRALAICSFLSGEVVCVCESELSFHWSMKKFSSWEEFLRDKCIILNQYTK